LSGSAHQTWAGFCAGSRLIGGGGTVPNGLRLHGLRCQREQREEKKYKFVFYGFDIE